MAQVNVLREAQKVVKTLQKWFSNPRVLKLAGTTRYKVLKELFSVQKGGLGLEEATEVIKARIKKKINKRIDDRYQEIKAKDIQKTGEFDNYIKSLEDFGLHFRGKLTSLSNETNDIFSEGFAKTILKKKFNPTTLASLALAEEEIENKLFKEDDKSKGENFLEALRNTNPRDWYYFEGNPQKDHKIDLGGILNYIAKDFGMAIAGQAIGIISKKLSDAGELK